MDADRCLSTLHLVQQHSVGSNASAKPPRRASKATPARPHHFYPTSLPRSINNRSHGRQASLGQSPPASAAGIGWLLGSSPAEASQLGSSPRSSHLPGSSPRLGKSPLAGSLPLPHFQHPSYELLDRNGFQQMKYDRWKQRCLDDRAHTGELAAPSCIKF